MKWKFIVNVIVLAIIAYAGQNVQSLPIQIDHLKYAAIKEFRWSVCAGVDLKNHQLYMATTFLCRMRKLDKPE